MASFRVGPALIQTSDTSCRKVSWCHGRSRIPNPSLSRSGSRLGLRVSSVSVKGKESSGPSFLAPETLERGTGLRPPAAAVNEPAVSFDEFEVDPSNGAKPNIQPGSWSARAANYGVNVALISLAASVVGVGLAHNYWSAGAALEASAAKFFLNIFEGGWQYYIQSLAERPMYTKVNMIFDSL